MSAKINGIDVSKWQGTIDWAKVKAAGIKFAMIRLGYCGHAGGVTVDSKFAKYIKGAQAAGLDVGVYLFSYALNAAAAQVAAAETLDLIAGYNLTYPVVFDIEDSSSVSYSGMAKATNTAIVKGFCSVVEDAGYYSMIYASKSFLEGCLNMSELPYDVWVAQWAASCTYSGSYGMWQYSETGSVNGISGNVDMNYAYQDYPTLTTNPVDEDAAAVEETVGEVEDNEAITYTVVKNDTLTRIAKLHGVPLMQLIKANPQIKNPDLIYVGDTVNIPVKEIV